jgi:hypothetical protein
VHGETTKDSISALREQTALAKTRLHGVLRGFASRASGRLQAVQRLSVLIAASLVTISCASSAPEPDTGVEPDRTPAPVVRETPKSPAITPVRASFAYAPGTASYVVTSEATIAEIDSATAPRVFRDVARVDLMTSPAEGYTIVTTTGSVEGTSSVSIIQPYADTLRAGSMDTAAEPRMPICGRDTVPLMHLVTLLPPVPQELREGARWQRRHVYGSCQGMIPVRVERTDNYLVTGRAPQVGGSGGLTITRTSSFAYAGSGVEGQHNVRLTGAGSGQTTLILDASLGRLVTATEDINSEIGITASGRTRRFSQKIVRTVQLQ